MDCDCDICAMSLGYFLLILDRSIFEKEKGAQHIYSIPCFITFPTAFKTFFFLLE